MRAESDVTVKPRARAALGLPGGSVIANPIPAELEIPYGEMETVIAGALSRAHDEKVSGKALTPYLLRTIVERTGGRSLEANIALVRHNAALGARIASLLSP